MKRRGLFSVALAAAMGVLLVGAVGLTSVIHVRGYFLTKLPIQPREKLHTLPAEYPSWVRVGEDEVMSAEAEEELGTKDYVSRQYIERNPADPAHPKVVNLHIAYYTGMIETVPHVPERCLVAAGWLQTGPPERLHVPLDMSRLVPDATADPDLMGGTIWMGRSPTTQGRVRLPVGIENLRMRVSPFVNSRGAKYFAGYFFITNGGTVPSADDIRLLAFRLKDDYAYYAKVQFSSGSVDSAQELVDVAASMLNEMFPDIMLRMPDWVEVKTGRYPDSDSPQTGSE